MKQLFKEGDFVIWDIECTAMTKEPSGSPWKVRKVTEELAEKYGLGPFRISRVMENSVRHTQSINPQNLMLIMSDGTEMFHPGDWFVKAPSV